ncbi:DNA-binding transcriptional MerR regulator [Streptomyces sp. 846.5]|nr:MerR family transcriptional regulator [Streptomyces sp. 846.5]TDU02569.1 DNA-binding transcriptional MerR regulator [Streptomyces sp. 846.5]
MRIGDAAAAAGTTPRALRFYEQRGLLPPPVRTATGQRLYGQADVDRVRVIRQLLALGMTVEDLHRCADRLHLCPGDALPSSGRPEGICSSTDGIISRRLAAIDTEIARLTGLRELLSAAIAPPSRR